jgi:hypothetical protein
MILDIVVCIELVGPWALQHHARDLLLPVVHVEAAGALLTGAGVSKAAQCVDARNSVAMHIAASGLGALGAKIAETRHRRTVAAANVGARLGEALGGSRPRRRARSLANPVVGAALGAGVLGNRVAVCSRSRRPVILLQLAPRPLAGSIASVAVVAGDNVEAAALGGELAMAGSDRELTLTLKLPAA